MNDIVFREKTEPVEVKQPAEKIENPTRGNEDKIEVPYMDYSSEHNHPYLVDHFGLGDRWDDVFSREVQTIEGYIKSKIESGEIANSIPAIKGLIKDMEKFNNLTKEERAVVKLEVLSNYVEFLMKNEKLKANLRRYNGSS